jgi:hypothetical protein
VNDPDWVAMLHRVAGDTPASELVLPILQKQGRAAAIAEYAKLKTKPGVIADESDLFAAGVAADRAKNCKLAEQALYLNLALYPKSSRTLLALGRVQAHQGKRKAAIESLKRVPNNSFFLGRANVELAKLGTEVDGHVMFPMYHSVHNMSQWRYTGRYKSKELRYVVETKGDHLLIREYDPMGDLNDEYEAFEEPQKGLEQSFYVPADGSSITFEGKNMRPDAIVRTIGKDKQRGERVKP